MRTIEESAWWWAAVAGNPMPIHDNTPPMPGFYKARLVPRGPLLPGSIYIIREEDEEGEILCDDRYGCEVAGELKDPFEMWFYLCKHPISREEYELMKELAL